MGDGALVLTCGYTWCSLTLSSLLLHLSSNDSAFVLKFQSQIYCFLLSSLTSPIVALDFYLNYYLNYYLNSSKMSPVN